MARLLLTLASPMNVVNLNEGIDRSTTQEIRRAFKLCFGEAVDTEILDRAEQLDGLSAILAYVNGELAGFKLGFRREESVFFSWVGGVLPNFRRRGIARTLLLEQHKHARGLGYREIQTEVSGQNSGMLILNLEEGFLVSGAQILGSGECILLMSKKCI